MGSAVSFPLRLCPSLRDDATQTARAQGISLNHFISLAVAEKLVRMQKEHIAATNGVGFYAVAQVPKVPSAWRPSGQQSKLR